MKIAGMLMVVASCSAFGFSMAKMLAKRAALLRSFSVSLVLLRNALCGALLPVGEALAELADGSATESSAFYARCMELFDGSDIKNAWVRAAMECSELGLDREECRTLAGLGGVIGRYEAERQQELINRAIEYFEARTKLAETEKLRQYKLRAGLGLGAGLMLAILML